jgi:DNA repair and recombination protein RAD52
MREHKKIIELLNEGLPKHAVSKRKQGTFEVSYVEGWFAIAQANRIFGHDRWGLEVKDIQFFEGGKGHEVVSQVRITVRLESTEIIKEDVGYGSSSVKQGRELAVKEAVTDGMKRAFRGFGAAFGNSLYDKANPIHQGGTDSHAKVKQEVADDIIKSLKRDLAGADDSDGWRKVMNKYKTEIPKCPPEIQAEARKLAKAKQKEID